MKRIRFSDLMRRYAIFIILVLIMLFFSLKSDVFLSMKNLMNVARQVATIGIASVGIAMLIISGNMDLTPGSSVALVGIVCALMMTETEMPVWIVMVTGILMGGLIGFVNGILVEKVNMPAFIVTFSMMNGIRGVAFILSNGIPIFGFPKSFGLVGKGYLGPVPIPVIIMIVILIFGWILINKTKYGRYLYAIGGNREAARLSGIDVKKTIILTYVISGLLVGVSGVVLLSRLSSGQPTAGQGFEFEILTAVILGGISINGGEGKFGGVIVGVLIMGVLSNGLTLINVYEYYQMIIKCVVLILAVAFDSYSKSKASAISAVN